MSVESHGVTDAGRVRAKNEDRILLEPALGLYAVFDGMGGHQNGALAAEIAIAALRYFIDASGDRFDVSWPFGYNFELSTEANRLITAMKLANRQICRRAEQELECAGMGTTIATALLGGDQAVIGNVGDSRVYRFRRGALTQLTVDDTMVGSLAGRGMLTVEEARVHPMRNVLTQAAGSQDGIDVHIVEEHLCEGDVLLLSSDGLHGVVGHDTITSILSTEEAVDRCSVKLLESALNAGAPDNVSVLLLRYS